MAQAFGQRLVGGEQHGDRPAGEQQQRECRTAGQPAGEQALAGAGQGGGGHSAERRRQAADQGQQGAGGGDMRIGERGQPLVAQAQETAEHRQDQRQAEAGQERQQKEVRPHRPPPARR